jgi:small nuclear ribonucleoprotein (snRNP)-like protein
LQRFCYDRGLVRYVSFLLITALVFNPAISAGQTAATPQITERPQETSQIMRIRIYVQQRGAGENSRVKVKLHNNAEIKGYINAIDETSFAVTDRKTDQSKTILYGDVQRIGGSSLSKRIKIGRS